MKRKLVGIIALAVIIAAIIFLIVFNINSQKDNATIYVMPKEYSDITTDFWISMVNGAKAASEELDVDIEILAPEREVEYEEQQRFIDEVLNKDPMAVVLCPCSPTETYPYAKKIEDADIPLVIVDSVMEKSVGNCVVSTDNIHAGLIMGEYIKKKITDNDYIGIISHVKGSSTAVERENGVREGLMDAEDKIVSVVYSNSDYDQAYSETLKMLDAHPEITIIAGLNEYSSTGAARAIKDSGRAGKIMLIGFDSSIEEIQLLEEGVFEAIVVQYPFDMGYLGVLNAYKLAKGETVEFSIDSGTSLITKEDIYKEENQKTLFPFS